MELTTKRLLLRPFQETDHEDPYEFLSQLEKDEFEGYPDITRESSLEQLKDEQGNPIRKDTYVYAMLNREYMQQFENEPMP